MMSTKHLLRCTAFYINDDPMVQNSLYFGNSLGNNPSNWNDPQAAGGAISSTNSFTIAEDDMNWGYILPFDISAVEVQCSFRPAGGSAVTGDDFSLAIYTANRSDSSNTVITLTKVAHQADTFSNGNYATNDLTYTGDLVKGTCKQITSFGAFFKLENGIDVLCHTSEISYSRVNHPDEVLSLNDVKELKIIEISLEKLQLSVSIKALMPDPFDDIDQYSTGKIYKVKIHQMFKGYALLVHSFLIIFKQKLV